MAEIVLLPGFWLGAWAWDGIAGPLRDAGHSVTAVTLPGLESVDVDRRGVTLDDQIDSVVRLLEERRMRDVMLVGHSGAGSVVYGMTDRIPERIAMAVYVDSGPMPEGAPVSPGLAPDAVEIPLPEWDEMVRQGNSIAGLDEAALAEFRARAVPEPAGAGREGLHLMNPARLAIPTTLVNCSISTAEVKELIGQGHPWFVETGRLRVVRHVDLPTGHWPMFSRPADLAKILAVIAEEVDVAVASADL